MFAMKWNQILAEHRIIIDGTTHQQEQVGTSIKMVVVNPHFYWQDNYASPLDSKILILVYIYYSDTSNTYMF